MSLSPKDLYNLSNRKFSANQPKRRTLCDVRFAHR